MNDKLLDVRGLQAFTAVMSSGSMTLAAAQLGTSQPAVTRMIRELEESVGFKLFHRNGPRISPTDHGLRFYEEARRVIASIRQVQARADAILQEREASIDIAATPTMAGGLVGASLARLGGSLPHAINVQTVSTEYVVRSVRAHTADFGISGFPLDYAGLTTHVVCEGACVAVVSKDDPLASAAEVELDVLAERRMITVGNVYRLRSAIEDALIVAEVAPEEEFFTNSSLNAVMAARAGLGVALIDPVTAYGIPVEGVLLKPLAKPIPYRWGLFSNAEHVLSSLMESFVEAFRETCVTVIPNIRILDENRGTEP